MIDVRTPDEYAESHIDGAINIPLDDIASRLDEISSAEPVVVYCRSGGRAAQAASVLCGADFDVYDLGPMSAWSG